MAEANRELNRFILDGLPPAQRGVPQVEVTFDIDANGILAVAAQDKATGKEQSIRIEGSGGLSKDEIDGMVEDAEAHAGEDKDRREQVEKRNQLDSMIHGAEKTLSENGDKIDAADRAKVEAALTDAKGALESGDATALDAARERVESEMHAVAEALYKAQAESAASPEGATEGPGDGASGDDDVIDAEYTEDKDGKS